MRRRSMFRNKGLCFLAVIVVLTTLAVSCGRGAGYYVGLGNGHLAKGEYDEAVLSYRKAIQKDQQSGEAYYQLSRTFKKLGKFSDAYQNLQSAEQLLSGREDVRAELGNL